MPANHTKDELRDVQESISFQILKGMINKCEFCRLMYTTKDCPSCGTIRNIPKPSRFLDKNEIIICFLCKTSKKAYNYKKFKGNSTGRETVCKECKKNSL